MNLVAVGCNFRTAGVELREKLVLEEAKQERALNDLSARFDCEVVLISTCNRVELYVAREPEQMPFNTGLAAEFLSEACQLASTEIEPHLYSHCNDASVRHLFRVASSLDSLIVGEGQIAGQVKQAFEMARKQQGSGPLLNALFPHALRTAKRVRSETRISHGHVSVSSVAVDYVRQVFDHFHDKTVLLIGAGKMARLTLKHLQELHPGRILVTNRSPQKAMDVAAECGGVAVPWENLDAALIDADIVLSTTGAPEQIMSQARFHETILPHRSGTMVILDIAVPRDFDPAIHDGDQVCLFNIDDLTRIREQTLATRHNHIAPAEAIIDDEVKRFLEDWNRRRTGPVIGQLHAEVDKLRGEIVDPLMTKLNGKLSPEERKAVEYAFRLFQNKILHGPIAALQDASRDGENRTMLETIRKLFRLGD